MSNRFPGNQYGSFYRFVDITDMEVWLDDFLKTEDDPGDVPYYRHLDHVQVIPPHGEVYAYTILVVYREMEAQP